MVGALASFLRRAPHILREEICLSRALSNVVNSYNDCAVSLDSVVHYAKLGIRGVVLIRY